MQAWEVLDITKEKLTMYPDVDMILGDDLIHSVMESIPFQELEKDSLSQQVRSQ